MNTRLHLRQSLPTMLLAVALLTACRPEAQQAAPATAAPQGPSQSTSTVFPTMTPVPTSMPMPTFTPAPATGEIHLSLIWPEQAGTLSPILAIGTDGTLYVMDDKATLHAVAPTGQERWAYRADADLAGAPMMSGDGAAVQFLTSNNELISVGIDGKPRWTFKADDVITALPVVAPGSTVYLRTRSGGHRVSPGGKGQSFTWPEWTDRSRVAFDSKGQLYLWNPIKNQLLIVAPDGKVSKQCDEETQLSFGPVIGKQDIVLYTLADGTLIARDTACKELWRYSLGTGQARAADYPFALGMDDTVYASASDGRIHAINAERGKPLWTSEPSTAGAPVDLMESKDGTLYALSDQATLLGFRDGKQIWSQTLAEPNMPGPLEIAPDGGLALIQAGQLYLFTRDPALVRALPTPVPPPADNAQAEKEITDFLVDFIVQQEIGGTADYIRNSGQPWVSSPPKANIIVWAPAVEKPGMSTGFLQSAKPTRVWWYADDKLTETDDKLQSIEEYKQRYMQKASPDIWAWGYYEFGVISIADDRQTAKVYVGASCGSLCGHGFYYTLRRSPSGKWWITNAEHLWQS